MKLLKSERVLLSLFWFLLASLLFTAAWLVRAWVSGGEPHEFFGLELEAFFNYHFAFSFPMPVWLMYGVYGVLTLTVAQYLYRSWFGLAPQERLAWLLVVVGGAANVIERIVYGYVLDYLKIGTAYLNVADCYIVLGLSYLLIQTVLQKKAKL